ncbi:hypothetical protein CBW16_05535 [Flavobacteriaceae bacterium JJC]|uniref:hypothetical protein n=1 Tax=Kaistella soli TaxID=2849654 RepID=UPI000B6E5CCB|nr:hypothetical protein [Kaistella soli]MBU8883447.1 hypothetical protein [Kaistella soli]OWK74854.1 hypothetical protein CBW16_05535 [Flavobacteriaceae bacterium JJC]
MKKLLILLVFSFTYGHAQYLVEDNDISENTKELGKISVFYELNNPLEFYRLKCDNAVYAQFPGGENAFKRTLYQNMQSVVNSGVYSVNGTFELQISINKSGKLESFQLKPEVPNSNLLYRDLEMALKKITTKWTPGSCSGVPVDSKLRLKVNFRTDSFDI